MIERMPDELKAQVCIRMCVNIMHLRMHDAYTLVAKGCTDAFIVLIHTHITYFTYTTNWQRKCIHIHLFIHES
jgi:hypothetical protein